MKKRCTKQERRFSMEKRIKPYTKWGMLLVIFFGFFLHFLYELTGKLMWVALFSPINESVWEHMKLAFFPLLVYFLYEMLCIRKQFPSLSSASAWGILTGTFAVPVIFYTYTGILGFHLLALDILTLLLGLFLGFYGQQKKMNSNSFLPPGKGFLSWGLVILMCLCFFLFTFWPPALPLFTE